MLFVLVLYHSKANYKGKFVSTPRQRSSDQSQNILQVDHLSDHSITSCIDYNAEEISALHGDGVIGFSKKGNIEFINKAACKLTGWLASEIENQKLEKIFQLNHNVPIETDLELINSVIDSGHIFGPITLHTIKTKTNCDVIVNFSISPLDENTIILMFHPSRLNNIQHPRSLIYQVTHDPLTRLENRDTIQQTIARIHKNYHRAEKTYSIFLLNIDRFKLINDCYGNNAGDQVLQLIAERMQVSLRDIDVVGRWGGEEFICIMPGADINTACKIAERLCCDISDQPYVHDSQEIAITASIGIANFPIDGDSPDELFRIADSTLYEAKKNGRNRCHSSNQVTGNIYSIGTLLKNALNENRITPVYQPIFEISSGKEVAKEALARIQDKDGQLIEAYTFIDAAVELQLAHLIDYQIIKKMIIRCTENFIDTQNTLPHFVNVSADLLRHPQLVKDIINFATMKREECGQNKCNEKPIVIEITEQELLGDVKEVKNLLAPFLDFGLPLAIDDFGSGYSSLTYLADLPISYLKFDGSLIKRVAYEDRARKIITGIQRMAESLELITIAEHIEDQATLNVLREIGVAWGQGYFSAKPSQ